MRENLGMLPGRRPTCISLMLGIELLNGLENATISDSWMVFINSEHVHRGTAYEAKNQIQMKY